MVNSCQSHCFANAVLHSNRSSSKRFQMLRNSRTHHRVIPRAFLARKKGLIYIFHSFLFYSMRLKDQLVTYYFYTNYNLQAKRIIIFHNLISIKKKSFSPMILFFIYLLIRKSIKT